MKRKDYFILFLISFLVIAAAGILQKSPGYMDAEYYAVTGRALSAGKGFTQDFLWNYLDDPQSLPHPSNTYWMPLASLLAVIQTPFTPEGQNVTLFPIVILLSSLVPVLSAWAANSFTLRRSDAWMAGLLGLFSGFYFLYYAIPETFVPEMVFGVLLIFLLDKARDAKLSGTRNLFLWGLIGFLCGLLHMARAEGLIWLGIAAVLLLYLWVRHLGTKHFFLAALLLAAGYLVVSGCWYARNVAIWNQPFPPGNNRTLWIADYDQMFLYPASTLTYQFWINQGIQTLFHIRLDALWMNIKSAVAVQGGILLLPFMIAGWIAYRKDTRLILAGIYYGLIFFLMTFVFPLAGSRGGFIHAASGVQVLFWALVPVGLDRFIRWGNQKRGWKLEEARRVFQIGIVAIMILLTGIIFYQRVLDKSAGSPAWIQEESQYRQLFGEISNRTALDSNTVVMVKNPPGWNFVTGMKAIVIPDGGADALSAAAEKFGAGLLILDQDHPKSLGEFYATSGAGTKFKLLFTSGSIQVYAFSGGWAQ